MAAEDQEPLLGLAESPAAPADVLLRLLAPEARVSRDAVCRDRALPPEVVEALLVHPDRDVRRRVAANPHVEARQRERLDGAFAGPRDCPSRHIPRRVCPTLAGDHGGAHMTVTSTRMVRGLAAVVAAVCAFTGVNVVGNPASADVSSGQRADEPRLTWAQRQVLWEATAHFRSIRRAVAAGYRPTDQCVPGMGYHYVHPALAGDTNIDPTMPEILVYAPRRDGSLRLAALEYFRADADGNKATAQDRPTLFGHPFDGPMDGHPMPPGAPPMPVHYDLHVWLYRHNPAGELKPDNPTVRCP